MNYEIVYLEEKKAAGLKIRTNNDSPDMGAEIGGLWKRFFEEGIFFQMPGKVNDKSIGLYTNYAGGHKDDYDMFVCCEIDKAAQIPESLATTVIPKGNYAKFIVKGNMVTAVQEFWMKLWSMDLKRTYVADFEEYQPGGDMDNAEIHMYIGIENAD